MPEVFSDIDRLVLEARRAYAPRCETSLELAMQAAARASHEGYAAGEAEALLWWGKSALVISGPADAQPLLRRALQLAESLGEARRIAEVCQALGDCSAAAGNEDRALRYWLQGLDAALAAKAVDCYVDACIGIGNLYFGNDDALAIHFHMLAAEFAGRHDDADRRARANIHLAAGLIRLKEFEIARILLQTAKDALELPLRRDWLAEIHNYLGMIATETGELDIACAEIESAYALNREGGFRWSQTVNLIGLAGVMRRQHRNASAIATLNEAQLVLGDLYAPQLAQQIHEALASLYEAEGDYERALSHHLRFHEHYLQHTKAQQADQPYPPRYAGLETKLKLASSEIELSLLRQQNLADTQRVHQLEAVAYRDALTGAYNRRVLDEQLPALIEHTSSAPLSLLLVDFDHFKLVNDRFSHLIGDRVLQTGVQLMQQECRDNDLVCRYGGEEFMVVLPDTARVGAIRLAERIRARIEAHDWHAVAAELTVTASIGCAELGGADGVEQLLARADAALYEAKRGGRNRVCASEAE